jgi:putative ABC transport system permease protein
VVGDVRQYGLGQEVRPEIYVPFAQLPSSFLTVVLRTTGDPLALTEAVRREVRSLDPNLPVERFTTLDEIVQRSVAQPRFYTTLLTLFAAVALALAAVGIFGVMSFAVAQRTREIGIRVALGAVPGDVLRLVVGRAVLLAAGGVAVGLVGALFLTRWMTSLLFGVGATDPLTYLAVAATLLGVATAASYLPARAATRVDPMIALRAE